MAVGRHRSSRPGKAKSPAVPKSGGWPDAVAVDRLLSRVARGDAGAFAEVCDQVSGAVYGLVQLIVRGERPAEQVAAEVLLEVWRSAPQFSAAQGSGLSWIMTLARRRATSWARTAGSGSLAGPGPAVTAAVTAERAPGSLAAHHGLTALPAPQREAMLLAYCGHTGQHAAELAGVPADTVARWLRDGMLGLGSRPE
jgi:RNA polymerase sigma-70 factor (ECF subfamily)